MIKCFNGTTSTLDTVMKPTNAYKHLRVSNIILQYASYMLRPVLWSSSGRCIAKDILQKFLHHAHGAKTSLTLSFVMHLPDRHTMFIM
jgi:hypothetical protein